MPAVIQKLFSVDFNKNKRILDPSLVWSYDSLRLLIFSMECKNVIITKWKRITKKRWDYKEANY